MGKMAIDRRAIAAVLIAVAVTMGSIAWRKTVAKRRIAERSGGDDRIVDMGLVLNVVRQDLANGTELIPGSPPLVVLRRHRFGGMCELGRKPRIVGPSRTPHEIYCSEDAEPIILHRDEMPDRIVITGSEGVGKTRILAQWLIVRALEATGSGHVIGVTSPTTDRSEEVKDAIEEMAPPSWISWHERKRNFRMRNGVRLALKSTHQSSKAAGSRMQSHNFRACASDEIQDSLEADADIEMRGRKAPNGRYKRLCTATIKDSPDLRSWLDRSLAGGMWRRVTLLGPRSPFVWSRFWEDKRKTLTESEYRRRIKCEDIPSEKRLYYTWDRTENMRPIPLIGAQDVTAELLHPYAPGATVLAGHDPGKIVHTTELLKAYRLRGRRDPAWFVVGEVVTTQKTIEEHCAEVRRVCQSDFDAMCIGRNRLTGRDEFVEGTGKVFVRCDPYTDSGNDEDRPDSSVYTTFRKYGFEIQPAVYRPGTADPGRVPKEARLNMMNLLMRNCDGDRRLLVACSDDRIPNAPRLVDALETMERDDAGRAEKERKDKRDKSHYGAAVGYALWLFERPSMGRAA